MRILTLFARHGREKYATALDELRTFQRRCLPRATFETLVVDNAPQAALAPEAGCEVIPGSNRAWEFSAWDDAVAHVGNRIFRYDLVQLVTSAFNTLYTRYIERLDDGALELVAGRAAAVGHVDRYLQPVELLGIRSQYWLRSSYLFVPPAELVGLGSLCGLTAPERLFSGDPARPFRDDAPISPNYRRYILDWLTGEGTGQGVTWHSRFDLDRATLPFFEAKASAILNEHLLSIRLRRQGCAIVDATFLGTVARQPREVVPPAWPEWRAQLAARDTDAVPLVGPS
jgi:hypothetical protein